MYSHLSLSGFVPPGASGAYRNTCGTLRRGNDAQPPHQPGYEFSLTTDNGDLHLMT